MTDFVDFQAQHNPHRPFAVFPKLLSNNELLSVSYLDVSNATHRIAHRFNPGRANAEGCVVALLLHTDTILYVTLILGLLRAGYIVSIRSCICLIALFADIL